MAIITSTPAADLALGDCLLDFSSDERDGEAGTYDERDYNDLKKRALAQVQATLPEGWTAAVVTDERGACLVARHEDGRETRRRDTLWATHRTDRTTSAWKGHPMRLTPHLSVTIGRTVTVPHPNAGHEVTGRIVGAHSTNSDVMKARGLPVERAFWATIELFGDAKFSPHTINVPALLVADTPAGGPLMSIEQVNADFCFLLNELRAVDGGEERDSDTKAIIGRLRRLADHLNVGGRVPDANRIIAAASAVPIQG